MSDQQVALRIASVDDRPTVGNLLQLYLHDMSDFVSTSISPEGRFAYPYLDRYWSEEGEAEGRVPFIFTVNGELAGFALKNSHSRLGQPPPTSSIAEFFVLRPWRGQGVGRAAAYALFDHFAGRWEVAQLRTNEPAHRFWRRVIDSYTTSRFLEEDIDTERWNGFVQAFDTPAGKHL
jgi:predicted acetyltransferase